VALSSLEVSCEILEVLISTVDRRTCPAQIRTRRGTDAESLALSYL